MPDKPGAQSLVLTDEGGVNARILAREARVDFRRIEAASVKLPTRFTSAEGKRMFVRLFNTLQLNAHFISVIARTRLEAGDIQRAEFGIRTRLDAANTLLNEAIDAAEAQFKAHGITGIASYDTLPLELDVHVMSSTGRRYLDLLTKLDQLMPMLQTLEIHEVLSADAVDQQRARAKRQVREVANNARRHATDLRKRMNAMDAATTGRQAARLGTGGGRAGSGAMNGQAVPDASDIEPEFNATAHSGPPAMTEPTADAQQSV